MRRRILATVLAATVLAVAALFLPAASASRDRERRSHVLVLQRDALVVASRVPAPPLPAGFVPSDVGGHRYALYDRQGARLVGDGPDRADPTVERALADQAAEGTVGDDLVAAVPLFAVDGRPQLVLRAEEPVADSEARVRASVTKLALAALAALVAAGLAAWLLVRRLVRPLDELGAVAAAIGDGDFTVRAPTSGLPELDRVGEAFVASSERLGQLVSRERAFAADVSHQLRTPLAALRATLETELYAPRPDPTAVVEDALGVVDRLEATVTELLDLARDRPPDRAEMDLAEVVEAAAGRWQAAAARTGRTIEAGRAPVTKAHASRSAVDHILDVLIDNALRHGRGKVWVGVGMPGRDGAPTTTIVVRDEGQVPLGGRGGQDLFGRRSSGAGSTGIGLHLARTLAEAEGGRLRLATNEPTAFALTLRPVRGVAPPAAGVRSAASTTPVGPNGSGQPP